MGGCQKTPTASGASAGARAVAPDPPVAPVAPAAPVLPLLGRGCCACWPIVAPGPLTLRTSQSQLPSPDCGLPGVGTAAHPRECFEPSGRTGGHGLESWAWVGELGMGWRAGRSQHENRKRMPRRDPPSSSAPFIAVGGRKCGSAAKSAPTGFCCTRVINAARAMWQGRGVRPGHRRERGENGSATCGDGAGSADSRRGRVTQKHAYGAPHRLDPFGGSGLLGRRVRDSAVSRRALHRCRSA